MSDDEYWFPAKTYGWGWGIPSTWQGWVVLIAYFVFMIAGMVIINPQRHVGWYLAYVALITVVLLVICWAKGEPPRWRWGNDRE